jgi:hypothetical protein
MEKLKTIVLATSILLLTPSCSIYRNSGVLGFPEKEDFEEKIERYIAGADSVYSLESKENSYLREKRLNVKRKVFRF